MSLYSNLCTPDRFGGDQHSLLDNYSMKQHKQPKYIIAMNSRLQMHYFLIMWIFFCLRIWGLACLVGRLLAEECRPITDRVSRKSGPIPGSLRPVRDLVVKKACVVQWSSGRSGAWVEERWRGCGYRVSHCYPAQCFTRLTKLRLFCPNYSYKKWNDESNGTPRPRNHKFETYSR